MTRDDVSAAHAHGVGRVARGFDAMRAGDCVRVIPFVTAGYPDLATTARVLRQFDELGVGVCEIGVPFSDPIADGPVIASSMHTAIENGFTIRDMFEMIGGLRSDLSMALVAMSSVTLAQRRGLAEFVGLCGQAGVDGVLFPDLPVDESAQARRVCSDVGLACPMLVAPTTSEPRARQIAQAASGFVYLLARTGITGVRSDAPDIADRVEMLRSVTTTPIACGFGIGSAEAVQAVTAHADAAIVGSAIVGRMQTMVSEGRSSEEIADDARSFVAELAGV